MAGKVIRLLPDRIVFTKKIESWLHDMAREGLILKKMSTHFAVFEKGKLQDAEYRIVALDENYLTDENSAKYNSGGLELINKNGGISVHDFSHRRILFYVFKKEKSEESNVLYKQLMEKSKIVQKYRNEMIKRIIISGLFLIFALIFVGNIVNIFKETIYRHYATDMFIYVLALVTISCLHFIEYIDVRKYMRIYENGNNPKGKYKGNNRILKIITIRIIKFICFSLLVLGFLVSYYLPIKIDEINRKSNNFPVSSDLSSYSEFDNDIRKEETVNRDFITLYEIESYGINNGEDELEYLNFDTILWSYMNGIFCGGYYIERFAESDSDIKYEILYKHSIIKYMNSYAYENMMDYILTNKWELSEVNNLETDYFEKAAYAYEENGKGLLFIAYNNKELLRLYYTGNRTPDQVLEAIEYELTK